MRFTGHKFYCVSFGGKEEDIHKIIKFLTTDLIQNNINFVRHGWTYGISRRDKTRLT
jgi:hypothetical protein